VPQSVRLPQDGVKCAKPAAYDAVGAYRAAWTGQPGAPLSCLPTTVRRGALHAGGTSLVVTFTEPGDYQITCTIHGSMQTAIHVE
jgi:plastocyanin